jgi:hypothetical protein
MRGLDPRIHALNRSAGKDVGGRVKPGHDGGRAVTPMISATFSTRRDFLKKGAWLQPHRLSHSDKPAGRTGGGEV